MRIIDANGPETLKTMSHCNSFPWGISMRIPALVTVALLAAGPAAASNLVTNGSFESGLDGWTVIGSESQGYPPVAITYGEAVPYPDGAFGEAVPPDNAVSLSLDPVGTRAAYFVSDFSAGQGLQQSVFLNPGKYNIGFSYYAPANGYANGNDARFSGTVGGVTLVNALVSAGPSTTWLNFTGLANIVAAGNYDVAFVFDTNGFPAKDVVIDRVYIQAAVPEPQSWAMLIAGFGLIGAAARRRRVAATA